MITFACKRVEFHPSAEISLLSSDRAHVGLPPVYTPGGRYGDRWYQRLRLCHRGTLAGQSRTLKVVVDNFISEKLAALMDDIWQNCTRIF